MPRWLGTVIAGLCFVLPALGLSVLAILLGEEIYARLGRNAPSA